LAGDTKELPLASGWNRSLSPIGSGDEDDNLCYLRYYADEESRADWMASFPDYLMPERMEPPHDRDRYLPQPVYETFAPGDDPHANDASDDEDELGE
jgi:hypothetical protein